MTHHPECEDATGEYPGSCTCAIIKRREAMTEITQADCDVAEYIAGDRARDVDYQVVPRHRQCGYDQGYYDGRQADGAAERAKIVAWLRDAGSVSLSYGLLGRDLSAILEVVADAMEAGEHETFTRSSDT